MLKKRDPNTTIMLLENNEDFYSLLKEKFKMEKNLYNINGSAEKIDQYLQKYNVPYADYVISGLPFVSLPKQVAYNILLNTSKILDKDGLFITFQYTKIKKKFIEQFFTKIEIKRELRNVPLAYVFNCSIQEKNVEENYGIQGAIAVSFFVSYSLLVINALLFIYLYDIQYLNEQSVLHFNLMNLYIFSTAIFTFIAVFLVMVRKK